MFIGPRADDNAGVRERVLAAERAAFDFVSMHHHPYVPSYLDTFSLIANLMARTSRLRFLTNVANLPLRSAPMLAKAATSIDRLSDGRFDLGFGAGRCGRRSGAWGVQPGHQELSIPPKISLEQAKGFSLFALRTILSGGADEIVELAKTNLRQLGRE